MKIGKFLLTIIMLLAIFFVSANKSAFAQGDSDQDKDGIPVLLYHHILKKSENTHFKNNAAVINLEDFDEQMKYLKDNGFYTATVSELEAYLNGELSLPEKTVVITFDDGHKTNYLYAYPTLKQFGFKATAFLITNRISDTPVRFNPDGLQFLSWPEINEMKDVFEFGSHTNGLHNNINGTAALLNVSNDVILSDFETSRNLLDTVSFAYPFGAYNQSTIELLKTAGYKYAFTIVPKKAKIGDNPYEIGRIGIYPYTTMQQFKSLFETVPTKKGWVKDGVNWSYYNDNGDLVTGWIKVKNIWYYLDQNGIMKTGWLRRNNNWYYLDNNGAMKTGWLKEKNNWFYLNSSGTMQVGWKYIGGKFYYFYNSGVMAHNTTIGRYKLNANGAWINR